MAGTIRILCTVVAGVVWFFACYAADWPAFRGNLARTGYYPEPVGCPAGAPLWKISLGCQIISSPAVVDKMLYIGAHDSCVYGIDCNTGDIRWKTKTGGWVDGSPLVDGNHVIVGSHDGVIYLLDKSSGAVLGQMKAGVQLSSPAVIAGGDILCGLGILGGGICAYGTASVENRLADPVWSIGLPQFTYSSPAVFGQAVVIGATNGKFYGIDAGRRDTIWSLSTNGVIYFSTPAIDNTTVYLAPGDDDRNVYAANLLTGAIIWKSKGRSQAADTLNVLSKKKSSLLLPAASLVKLLKMSPVLRKKTIQLLRRRGYVLPAVPLPGTLAKKNAGANGQFIPLGGMKTSSPAVGPNLVYVIQKELGYVLTSDSLVDYRQQFTIHAFDKSAGAELWSFSDWLKSSDYSYCSSPAVTSNLVFFGWGEGKMYVLDAQSGKKLWEDSVQGHILSSPAIANGRLYMATMAGNVVAYMLSATAPGLDFQTSTFCYPNPARSGVSHVQTYAPKPGATDIKVYTSADKPVLHITRQLGAGEKYSYDWDITHVANGVYFALVKMKYDDGTSDKKVVKIAVMR